MTHPLSVRESIKKANEEEGRKVLKVSVLPTLNFLLRWVLSWVQMSLTEFRWVSCWWEKSSWQHCLQCGLKESICTHIRRYIYWSGKYFIVSQGAFQHQHHLVKHTMKKEYISFFDKVKHKIKMDLYCKLVS